jgi:8-oxo-dGTP pyrophosphatase MutT (NUDIX family)
MSERSLRPVDASSIVLYRGRGLALEILVGMRGARHVFVPNRYVYPGGRVDAADARTRPVAPLRDDVAARLQRTASSAARARALAVAAIRELFEETGLLLAAGDDVPDRWHPDIAPRLDTLDYIFRAVTPPGRTRRFNTRFFLAEARHARGELRGDGELENLGWLGIEELHALPLMWITRAVLDEAQRVIDAPPPPDPSRPVPVSHPRREPGRLRYE